MRTKLSFELVCSKCGDTLECDSEFKDNRIVFNSAYTAESKMAIKPCRRCYDEAYMPIKLIQRALEMGQKKEKGA